MRKNTISNALSVVAVVASVASNVYLVNEGKAKDEVIHQKNKVIVNTTIELDKNKSTVSTLNMELKENQKVIDDMEQQIAEGKNKIHKLEQQQKEHPTYSVSRGSVKRSSGMRFEATAYSYTGSPTCTGVMPQAGRTIAVDPRYIPLGSKVYIEGLGTFIAEDTGGAIKGRIIDIYMGSESQCEQWGRQSIVIHIIN